MTQIDRHRIAKSFPEKYRHAVLNIEISRSNFQVFLDGIFATDMESKWKVFVLDNILYFARSWTNHCIYKVFIQLQDDKVILSDFHVNRDKKQYNGLDIESDTLLLRKLLQTLLRREDLYLDPKFRFPQIESILNIIDPDNNCVKSIGSNSVGLTKQIYEGLTTDVPNDHCEVLGWEELKRKIINKLEEEPLISLYVQNREDNSAVTYYFDKDSKELLGKIIIKRRLSSS